MKLYFVDSGLLCYLLGIRRVEHLRQHPLRGAIFKELDKYVALSGDPSGVLVYGGDASYTSRRHAVRAWWACT